MDQPPQSPVHSPTAVSVTLLNAFLRIRFSISVTVGNHKLLLKDTPIGENLKLGSF